MAKSLKDQLQEWKAHKQAVEGELRDLERDARLARVLADEARRKAEEAAKAPAPAEDDDEDLSDEELFRRAVEGMRSGSDAILRKYDRSDLPPSQRGVVGVASARKDISDQALFLQAVGEMRREDVERLKPANAAERKPAADARFARRVQKGEIEPQNVLDLHGDDRVTALKRTRVFIEAEAQARTEVVLVVHGKGAGVLASEVTSLLDEHPAVVEHLVAPRALGGEGARVVRLRPLDRGRAKR